MKNFLAGFNTPVRNDNMQRRTSGGVFNTPVQTADSRKKLI